MAAGDALVEGGGVQKSGNAYVTALTIQNPRELKAVQSRFLQECDLAGESFYYSWSVKNKQTGSSEVIEGPSIGMAMALVRSFGNCACEVSRVEETDRSYVYYGTFVDLETGSTITRPFRQSKKSVVTGRMDNERKDDVRFQIGASKCIRNVVLNALPKWLTDKGLKAAKAGVRARIEHYVNSNGIAKAIEILLDQLAGVGVTTDDVKAKCGVADIKALDLDMIVVLRGDLNTIQSGMENAETLFPTMQERLNQNETTELETDPEKAEPKNMGKLFGEDEPEAGEAETAPETSAEGQTPNEPQETESVSDVAAQEPSEGESPLGAVDRAVYLPLPKAFKEGLRKTKTIKGVTDLTDQFLADLELVAEDEAADKAEVDKQVELANEICEARIAEIREGNKKK